MIGSNDPAFQGVGVDDIGGLMHDYPSTSLLGEVFKAVTRVHVLLSEVAVFILEPCVIDGEELAEDLAFDLLHEVGEGVAVDEAALLGVMGVEVEVEGKPVVGYEMVRECLDAEDGGLQVPIGGDVEAVEVAAVGVHAEVAVEHAIHVDHGHHHEDEHLPQQVGPEVSLAGEEVDDSLHGVGGRGLPRMHPSRDQHHWLLEAQRTHSFREEGFLEKGLILLLLLVMGRDGEQMHWPSLD
jgi:hypothetical protein